MAAAMAPVAEGGVSECRERHCRHQGEQKEAGGAIVNGEGSDDDGGHSEGCGERGGDCFSHGGELCKQEKKRVSIRVDGVDGVDSVYREELKNSSTPKKGVNSVNKQKKRLFSALF